MSPCPPGNGRKALPRQAPNAWAGKNEEASVVLPIEQSTYTVKNFNPFGPTDFTGNHVGKVQRDRQICSFSEPVCDPQAVRRPAVKAHP